MRFNIKIIFRLIVLLIVCIILIYTFYYQSITTPHEPFIPTIRVKSHKNVLFNKIALAHYTTTYGSRTDTHSKVFNDNFEQICEILDPEEYTYADSVIVSIVDFSRFPTVSNRKDLYRKKHSSQLWVFNTEESPRNSYRTVKMKNITELDDWFNLTATLKPESDIHIQYKGYRVKPEIIKLLETKLNQTMNHTINSTHLSKSNVYQNSTSIYLNTLAIVLNKEFTYRQDHYSNTCPYTCNQPLPSNLLTSIQPYLPRITLRNLNRNIVYIAWFVSNCDSHSGREEYVLKLRSQAGIHVDVYGDCKSILNSHIIPIQCRKGTPNCMEKTLAHYRFYLSFENSKCDTYITEKYWMQGLNKHAVPIVMGAKLEQYKRIAVPNSYIHVDNYPTVEQLAKELHRLNRNDSEFVKYLQWTQIYEIDGAYQPMSTYDMHSTLCLLGHYQRLYAMISKTDQVQYLLKRIRDMFDIRKIRLPNFNWETATTKLVRISEFYNPKVNCWDNDYPSFPRRAFNFLFTWWKLP